MTQTFRQIQHPPVSHQFSSSLHQVVGKRKKEDKEQNKNQGSIRETTEGFDIWNNLSFLHKGKKFVS